MSAEKQGARASLWPRAILHVDMDAFFAAVEVLDDPALKGQPVIVGYPGARGVVSTASYSYEARACGVRSATPSLRARRLHPSAVWIVPRRECYAAVGREVRGVLARFSDLIEPLSLGGAFLDVGFR